MSTSERASECCSKLCILKGSSRALQGRAGQGRAGKYKQAGPQTQDQSSRTTTTTSSTSTSTSSSGSVVDG